MKAGDAIELVLRGRHALTIAAIDALLYLPERSTALLRLAVDVPALSPGWQQSFRELLEAADAPASPAWPGFRRLAIDRIVAETPSVSSFYLSDPTGAALPDAKPGQYLTLRVPVGGATAVRSYSISGRPDPSSYRISVKREPFGAVSRFLHDGLIEGAEVDVAAPRGDFVLAAGTSPVLLLSAGIGITPVLSMLAELAAQASDRRIWWVHVARTAADYGLAPEVERFAAALPGLQIATYVTREAPGPGVLAGRLDVAGLRTLRLPEDSEAYLCGPTGFLTEMVAALGDLGLPATSIHSEVFGALAPSTPGVVPHAVVPPHAPTGEAGTGPTVTFARSGVHAPWSERVESLLDFAESCDVPVRWSCRTGVCHTCITAVLSGDVAYSPEPLERPGAAEALLCCSRPVGEVVLDA